MTKWMLWHKQVKENPPFLPYPSTEWVTNDVTVFYVLSPFVCCPCLSGWLIMINVCLFVVPLCLLTELYSDQTWSEKVGGTKMNWLKSQNTLKTMKWFREKYKEVQNYYRNTLWPQSDSRWVWRDIKVFFGTYCVFCFCIFIWLLWIVVCNFKKIALLTSYRGSSRIVWT